MLVLAGLGNPGAKYAKHRHNVGFMAVDAIADAHGFGPEREKFQARIREGFLNGPGGRTKALILKPLTFMNESGRALRAAADFYKLSNDQFLVFYDELDLAPGKLRLKTGGGAAGHNGIRSIDAHLGNDFRRARIGIGHPGDRNKVSNYVLGDFAKADHDWLDPLLDAMARSAPYLTTGDDQRYASDVAQQLAPARKETKAKSANSAPDSANTKDKPQAEQPGPGTAIADAFKKLLG